MAGALMQGLFRNPLADPGLIGVSSGAALAAGIDHRAGQPVVSRAAAHAWAAGRWWPMAFGGSLLVTVLIYACCRSRTAARASA